MPVHLRRKAIRGGVLKQIHQDSSNVKNAPVTRGKRRSSGSPQQLAPSRKRAAFGDITNALQNVQNLTTKIKGKSSVAVKPAKKGQQQPIKRKEEVLKAMSSRVGNENGSQESVIGSSSGMGSLASSGSSNHQSSYEDVEMLSPSSLPLPESSSEDELFVDVEAMNEKNLKSGVSEVEQVGAINSEAELEAEGIVNIDEENKDDPNQSPEYAFGIFQYLKQRETLFRVTPYFKSQSEISTHMRAILMDWLVEVQENFELNHETLYLAVKLVDLYLAKKPILKDMLQLLGASALFISCKFDERCPPALEDFIFICDDAYDRRQFIKMEKDILRLIDYDLGMPLSYRFLRRYAKCVHASMETLTLGRFILELSLMESEFMTARESKLAAAALLLAIMMKKIGTWDATLEHFSGYKASDLTELVTRLNAMLVKPPPKQLHTVRTKYSHKVFYEVAKIPPMEVIPC